MIPIANINTLALDAWEQGERYASADASFGAQLGLTRVGVSMNVVPPGKSGCPFHSHRMEDEFFVILEGSGVYRFGVEQQAFGPGDVLGAPAGGPETAHQIINTGDVPLRYLGVSNRAAADFCEYPDSGKFMAKATLPDGSRTDFVGRPDSAVDYWDGEPGAASES
jgi:uncharacterized cupin superfamily protein